MTLPKKKSRNITVDGVKYRWTVGKIHFKGGMGYADVVVETPKGQVMKYTEKLKHHKDGESIGLPVTPAMVKEFIQSRV